MPRVCTICTNPDRGAIDAALVAGEPCAQIAARYCTNGRTVGRMALQRHKAEHLPASLAVAQAAQEATHGDDLLAQVRVLQGKVMGILAQAEAAGQLTLALQGVREARGCLELLGRLMGELQEAGPTVNVLVASPEWLTVRGRLLRALEPYPEARRAAAEVLSDGRPG